MIEDEMYDPDEKAGNGMETSNRRGKPPLREDCEHEGDQAADRDCDEQARAGLDHADEFRRTVVDAGMLTVRCHRSIL